MERHPDSASSPRLRADPSQAQTAPGRTWLHRLANVVVAIVVLAVAAGMFVFSYPGVHAIARQGGVSGQLARFYPALFDAVLVIACVAAVMLRDARWWARCWAWLVALVLLAAIGLTDVLHAMSYGLRQRPTEGVVAAAPVVAVLLAFSLFLTMLRQSRPQPRNPGLGQAPAPDPADRLEAEPPTAPMMFSAVDTVPALAAGTVPRPPAPPIALPAVPADELTADTPDAGDLGDRGPDEPAEPGDAAADRGTAVTREQPALFIGTSAPQGTTHPPTEESEAVEAQPPSAAVTSEPSSGSVAEPTPEAAAETSAAAGPAEAQADTAAEPPDTAAPPADAAAETSSQTADASADMTETPAETTETTGDTEAAAAETAPEVSAQASDDGSDDGSDQPPTQASASVPASTPAAIRYASSAATEQFANEDWEAEVDPALAGQVYPVLTSDPDIEVPPHEPGQSQDLEEDAPPFATAPFASVPRLNRVRVTPTPPTDDAAED